MLFMLHFESDVCACLKIESASTDMRLPEKEIAASAVGAMYAQLKWLLPAGTVWKIRTTERTDSYMH